MFVWLRGSGRYIPAYIQGDRLRFFCFLSVADNHGGWCLLDENKKKRFEGTSGELSERSHGYRYIIMFSDNLRLFSRF